MVVPTLEMVISVSTERTRGLAHHMKGVESVMDALETSVTGGIDPGLSGTLRSPLMMTSASQNALDLSLNSDLSLKLETLCGSFANRRKN